MFKSDWYIIGGMVVMGIVPDVYGLDLPFVVQFILGWAGVMIALHLVEKGYTKRIGRNE